MAQDVEIVDDGGGDSQSTTVVLQEVLPWQTFNHDPRSRRLDPSDREGLTEFDMSRGSSRATRDAKWLDAASTPSDSSRTVAVIVDPNRSYAELLSDRLRAEGLYTSVQVAENGQHALQLARLSSTGLLMTEWDLGNSSALALSEELRQQPSGTRHVVLARVVPDTALDRLLELNIAGVLLKETSLNELIDHLRAIQRGERRFCEQVRRRFLQNGNSQSATSAVLRSLTPRQLEVFVQLAQGATVKEVATRLQMSPKAVDSMKYRLMKAFDFHDRVELTRFAIREGLIHA